MKVCWELGFGELGSAQTVACSVCLSSGYYLP